MLALCWLLTWCACPVCVVVASQNFALLIYTNLLATYGSNQHVCHVCFWCCSTRPTVKRSLHLCHLVTCCLKLVLCYVMLLSLCCSTCLTLRSPFSLARGLQEPTEGSRPSSSRPSSSCCLPKGAAAHATRGPHSLQLRRCGSGWCRTTASVGPGMKAIRTWLRCCRRSPHSVCSWCRAKLCGCCYCALVMLCSCSCS
jgi:hypothetical protein